MNNRLEEIKKILPDNDNGDITEKDMRDAFAMTFDEIAESLAKPTATLSEPNLEYKYVAILDEQGNAKKMLAGDLGKNSANADLTTTGARTFTQAHNYTHNTAGYYYYLTGLADKSADTTFSRMRVQDAHGQEAWSNGKVVLENLMPILPSIKDGRTGNYDLGFSEHLVFNPTTGKLAKSDRPQIVSNFNVPSNITIRHDSQVSNVNWVAPPSIPQDMNNTIELIKNIEQLGFTKIPTSAFVMKKLPASSFPSVASNFNIPNFEFRDGEVFLNSNNVNVPAGFRDLAYQSRNENKALINLYINQELPSDRDWVVRFRNFNSHLLGNNFHSFLGFRENISDNVSWDVMNDLTGGEEGISSYIKKLLNGKGFGFKRNYTDYSCVDFYIIKKGAIISILIMDYRNGEKSLTTTTYDNTMKYIVFGANLNFSVFNKFYIKDISYWIEN